MSHMISGQVSPYVVAAYAQVEMAMSNLHLEVEDGRDSIMLQAALRLAEQCLQRLQLIKDAS